MAGKVLNLEDIISKDTLGCAIANMWSDWNNARQKKLSSWQELKQYIYATDTRHTSNNKLPWSNSTTLPKLTQIRDNLYANYIATMFPKRRWLNWEGSSASDEQRQKVDAIKDYMMWAVNQREFKEEIKKLVLDYIDYGNCFATVEWVDLTQPTDTGMKVGYIGPRVVRIPPQDFLMNPIAPSFGSTPKIWRAIVSLGEAKEMLERMSKTPEDQELARAIYDYLLTVRSNTSDYPGADITVTDTSFTIDGFDSYRHYLESNYVELLMFAGDIYDHENDELLKNHFVVVADRHKVFLKQPYPYPLAEIPIFHAGWRIRQDNLWAMGPLDNLVGLQYRLDHVENMKADIMDLTTYPVLKIKGTGAVGDFEWAPMERIYVDSDGDVDMVAPQTNVLQLNIELQRIEQLMEEMAGSPKEAMGFRTPGEKTAYEVQRLENAASRIFQNKISQFEEQIIEPLLNAMLVLAKENLTEANIRAIDQDYGVVTFQTITRSDLSANGRLKPVAARHFAEQAELVQNLTNFSNSPIMGLIAPHMSTVKLAEIMEQALNLEDYDIITPYVQMSEQAEAQRLQQVSQEQLMQEATAPTGLTPDDYSDPGIADDMGALDVQPTEE